MWDEGYLIVSLSSYRGGYLGILDRLNMCPLSAIAVDYRDLATRSIKPPGGITLTPGKPARMPNLYAQALQIAKEKSIESTIVGKVFFTRHARC